MPDDESAARAREVAVTVSLVLFVACGWVGIGYALGGAIGAIWSASVFVFLAAYLASELERREGK